MSTLLLRTSVRPQSQKSAVVKGTILAVIALACLSLIEFILPLLGLESLGGWAWCVRSAILGTGFVPYQKISWQKTHPDMLKVDEEKMVLCKKDKEVFSLPWSQIASFTFLDRGSVYGLAFTLKSSKAALRVLQGEQNRDPQALSFLLSSLEELSQDDKKGAKTLPNTPYTPEALPKMILAKSRKKYGVDIFLPYFTERSHMMLQQWYETAGFK